MATNGEAWVTVRRESHYLGIEDILLEKGRWFEPQQLPRRFKRGRLKQCFLNAGVHGRRDTSSFKQAVYFCPGLGRMLKAQHCLAQAREYC